MIKEQNWFKELFTDYQPFHTIDLLLNKEHLPTQEMPNLALVNTRLWKLAKKGDLRNYYYENLKWVVLAHFHYIYLVFVEKIPV